jgi:hypothetical protein
MIWATPTGWHHVGLARAAELAGVALGRELVAALMSVVSAAGS